MQVGAPIARVLPIYFVADESGSMYPHVGELNQGLVSLLDAMQIETMAAAKIRFCIIGFNESVRCYLEPSDLRQLEDMPELTAYGNESYRAAFLELRKRIPSDVIKLKSEGYEVHRPAVFFLSDGFPTLPENWQAALADLKSEDFMERPNILAFGIGEADSEIIRQVATAPQYAFVSAQGVETGTAIAEFSKALTRSVIASGQGLVGGAAQLQIEEPKGFVSLAIDTI